MADLFYALLIIWVLWRIFGGSVRTTVHNRHQYSPPQRQEGEVTITPASKTDQQRDVDKGEYVDYEEVK
jgi:hypothetical protein